MLQQDIACVTDFPAISIGFCWLEFSNAYHKALVKSWMKVTILVSVQTLL